MGRYEADHILFGAAYYDEYQPGCAVFLRDAIRFHIQVI